LYRSIPVLLLIILGCRAPQVFLERALVDVTWYEDGFELRSASRSYRYYSRKGREWAELRLLDDYRHEAIYTDDAVDGDVDTIRTNRDDLVRGAPGTEEIFARADSQFHRHSEDVAAEAYLQEWKAGGPGGFVTKSGVASH
jgi:hypothetical protein